MKNLILSIATFIIIGLFGTGAMAQTQSNAIFGEETVEVTIVNEYGFINRFEIPLEATKFEKGEPRMYKVDRRTYTFRQDDGSVVVVRNQWVRVKHLTDDGSYYYENEKMQFTYTFKVSK